MKLDTLENDISDLKIKSEESGFSMNKSCKECEEKFAKNCELEGHMVKIHKVEKTLADVVEKHFI